MPEIRTEFLFTIDLDFEFAVLGETPYGVRRIARLKSGSFDGPKLKGTVLPGGGAWTLVRSDDVLDIEVRLLLETSDKQQIYMHWRALRDVPKDVADRLRRGETVDPHSYYFRATPYFETSSETYGWMNRICGVASGSLATNARTLDVFQVLQPIHRDVHYWPKADIDVCTTHVRSKTTLITPGDPTKDQVVETRRVLREMNYKADRAIDEQTGRRAR